MGIGIFTRQPFSRNVTGVERNGEVGMVTLAHQVTPPIEKIMEWWRSSYRGKETSERMW